LQATIAEGGTMFRGILTAVTSGFVLAAACVPAWAQTADDAFGVWLNPENGSNVEFYRCGDGLCAKLTKVTDGQKTDDKNPDAAKRNQPIVGLVIMQDAKKSGTNKWTGTLYNREDGKSYAGTITVRSKDVIELAGCVAVVFCRTVTWTRLR
jgi:uncharacterized protein (DUF2147 family)